ncbi:PaaI family thioesterase [Asticcacaulis endophyticus]|uniref:Thioesterase n=1 Tax=Asticcacaulis endophyticus TaxID=1395890 RepID=A0A918QC53_9CAUL|nr:PaaI family thioesterase [Asticcacaulis endophyticus]GGZ41101.1 thioesterase [Asticcacaulis endophyticus]
MSHRELPENILEQIPFARFLGVKMELAGNELTLKLPYEDRLIGNPVLPALHGGVIGAFMEITAMAQLAFSENFTHMPKPINVSVQYLRSGKAMDTFARARLNRVGRTIANVDVIAWQDNKEMPIATLQSHFLLKG